MPKYVTWAVRPAVRDECPLTLRYGIPRGCARGAHAGRSGTLVAAWRHMARWVSVARAVSPPLSTFRRVRKDTEPLYARVTACCCFPRGSTHGMGPENQDTVLLCERW